MTTDGHLPSRILVAAPGAKARAAAPGHAPWRPHVQATQGAGAHRPKRGMGTWQEIGPSPRTHFARILTGSFRVSRAEKNPKLCLAGSGKQSEVCA